jgi:hypothetical protein
MTRARSRAGSVFALVLLAVTLGCDRDDTGRDAAEASASAGAQTARVRASSGTGRTAEVPTDPCAWLTVAEVEDVLGKLTGPPERAGDGCRYPVVADSALLARKARLRDLARQLPGPNAPSPSDSGWDKAAVIVAVDLAVDAASERASALAARTVAPMLARAAANAAATTDSAQMARAREGWDATSGSFSTFEGRIGHVSVTVRERNMMSRLIPFERKAVLAARVRDRIPDLPFANPTVNGSPDVPSGPDPCSLITRTEAEAVLGPLVVEPYHIGQREPLAEPNGPSCGYFTKQHHVLVVTPHWSDGKRELALMRGVGNLVSVAAPDADGAAADTLEGPWDEAVLGIDGSPEFLVGDRLLRISHATSSIDATQVLRLARTAVARLASSR